MECIGIQRDLVGGMKGQRVRGEDKRRAGRLRRICTEKKARESQGRREKHKFGNYHTQCPIWSIAKV